MSRDKSKLIKEYIKEIKNLEFKIRGIMLTEKEVILNALQTEFLNLINEIKENYKLTYKEIEELLVNKKLLKRHILK